MENSQACTPQERRGGGTGLSIMSISALLWMVERMKDLLLPPGLSQLTSPVDSDSSRKGPCA